MKGHGTVGHITFGAANGNRQAVVCVCQGPSVLWENACLQCKELAN